MARKVRYGSTEPRVWTKPLRDLTPDTSLGFSVITFAEDVLEIALVPWQKWLLIHALELRAEGDLRFRNVVILVARQNGKSTLSQVLALWWLYVCGCKTVLGTAQDLDTAEEVWEGAVEYAEETDGLREEVAKVVRVNGKKALVLSSGERYRVKAANRKAGRGLTGDRILLDELREHQSWDAWGAITKTTMARADAQVWCLSNAGDMTSIVLRYLRKAAHKPLGDPDGINVDDSADLLPSEDEIDAMAAVDPDLDDAEVEDFAVDEDDLAIFEWSATPGCDVWDRDEWAQANPSMGYTELSERTIASAARTDPEWVFRTEVLCQWSEGGLEGPFPAGKWQACAVELDSRGKPRRADKIAADSRITACLDVSWNRSAAYVCIAGHRADGLPQIEVAGQRYGTEWIVDWFCDPDKPHRATWQVAIQVGSPAWALAQPLIDAGIDVVEWKGVEVGVGTGTFYDTVRDEQLRHLAQPTLTVAAETAAVKILGGGSAVIDRKGSGRDAAPLIAGIGALWLLSQTPTVPPPPPPPPTGVRATDTKSRHPMATAGF